MRRRKTTFDDINAAKKQFGVNKWFDLDSPDTIEKIRAAIPLPVKKVFLIQN